MTAATTRVDALPLALSGTVYGALLNHRPQWDAIGQAAHAPPHGSPARAPVLAVKPRHTLAQNGSTVLVPADCDALEAGVSLGVVIGRPAYRLPVATARSVVAGYVVAIELNMPQASHYRPAAGFNTRDGFCPLSREGVAAHVVEDPDALTMLLDVDGVLTQTSDTRDRVRNVATLLSDVTAFMTLLPGDVLLLGASMPRLRVSAPQHLQARIHGWPSLSITLKADHASVTAS